MSSRTLAGLGVGLAVALGAWLAASDLSVHAQATPAPAAPPVLSEPTDFSLEETSGATRSLSDVRGRVGVVFYEDREHTSDNQDLKLTLHRFVQDNQLSGRMTTYAVANVGRLDGMMRDMARTAIRAIAAQYGIQILLDFDGTLQRAPLSFPATGATIALFDRLGRMRYRVTGAHTAAQQTELFRTLRQLLREH